MLQNTVIERHHGDKAVKIEPNRYGEGWDIRTMRNGFQWSGITGDQELLTMLWDALNERLARDMTADLAERPAFDLIRRVCEGRGSVQEGLRVADYLGKLEGILLSGQSVGAPMERSIATAHSLNGVARRAKEFRDKRGHWGTHAEALWAEVERLHTENQSLRNLAENLRPGPISEALAGKQYRAAVEMANGPEVKTRRAGTAAQRRTTSKTDTPSNLDHAFLSNILDAIWRCESALSLASSYRDITRAHDGKRIEAALSSARTLIDVIRRSISRRTDETPACLPEWDSPESAVGMILSNYQRSQNLDRLREAMLMLTREAYQQGMKVRGAVEMSDPRLPVNAMSSGEVVDIPSDAPGL